MSDRCLSDLFWFVSIQDGVNLFCFHPIPSYLIDVLLQPIHHESISLAPHSDNLRLPDPYASRLGSVCDPPFRPGRQTMA